MCTIISTFSILSPQMKKATHRVVPHHNERVLARERNLLFITRFRLLFQRYASALLLSTALRKFIKATKNAFFFCAKTAPASCYGNRGGSFALWVIFQVLNFYRLTLRFWEVLVISVFRGLSVHFSERFFQADHRFFDDLCLIGRAICKLFAHPAVEHRLCFFDLDAQQLVC